MSREDPQFKLRMPLELKARIEQAAKDSHRSLNAEIVARLEASFDDRPDVNDRVYMGQKKPPTDSGTIRIRPDVLWRIIDDAINEALSQVDKPKE